MISKKEIIGVVFCLLSVEASIGTTPASSPTNQDNTQRVSVPVYRPRSPEQGEIVSVTWKNYDEELKATSSTGETQPYVMKESPVTLPDTIIEYWLRPDGSIFVNQRKIEGVKSSEEKPEMAPAPEPEMVEVPVFKREFKGWTQLFGKKKGYGSHWEPRGTESVPKNSGVQAVYYSHEGERMISEDGKAPY